MAEKKIDITLPKISLPKKISDLEVYDIEAEFAPLMAEQEQYKIDNGLYMGKVKTKSDEDEIEIQQYLCPNGEVGYQIFVTVLIDGEQYIKSFGLGQENPTRSFPWQEIHENAWL